MGRLRDRSVGAATFAVLALLFVGLTVLLGKTLTGARLDLTQNRLYTLAPGTERLVGSLKEPLNLYFFFSQQASAPAPQLRAYANRVRELLEELAARSHGRIRLHSVDPQPYSDDEDRATEFGLKALPVGNGTEPVWFGLAGTNSTDGRAVIEFFQPQKEEFLEYDVARLIHQLAEPKRKVVGLLSSLPMSGGYDPASGGMRQPWVIRAELAQLFELKTVTPEATALPTDLDALMIAHPKGLSPALLYAIDQFVVHGGRVLLCIDPEAQFDAAAEPGAGAYAGADRSSTLEPLLGAWGIGFDPHTAIGDLEHALLVGNPQGGPPLRHLAFSGFGPQNVARNDVITTNLDTINVATPGFLTAKVPAGVEFGPLITSGAQAGPIPAASFAFGGSPELLRKSFKPTGTRYVIAARVSGLLPSAYPAGPPPGVTAPAAPAAAKAAANLVIVADTDFLTDMLWVRAQNALGERYIEPWASNGDFVLNALDNLTGSADLLGIRGRATFSRPFTRVEQLRARADERLRGKETELERELANTERQLSELQTRRTDQTSLVLTPEQQRALEHFQQEKLRMRKDLRAVRRGLDEEIENLGARLKVINVLAVPLLLSVAALVAVAIRRRHRRAPRARAP